MYKRQKKGNPKAPAAAADDANNPDAESEEWLSRPFTDSITSFSPISNITVPDNETSNITVPDNATNSNNIQTLSSPKNFKDNSKDIKNDDSRISKSTSQELQKDNAPDLFSISNNEATASTTKSTSTGSKNSKASTTKRTRAVGTGLASYLAARKPAPEKAVTMRNY